jgi:hypothetical protein
MTERIKKWPTYALAALEDTQAHLVAIKSAARKAQDLLGANPHPTVEDMKALILLSEVISRAAEAQVALSNGKNGER